MNTLLRDYEFDYVLNFAAESHVDRSIDSVAEFIETNIDGLVKYIRSNSEDGKQWQENSPYSDIDG